jgi:hypothetical protein
LPKNCAHFDHNYPETLIFLMHFLHGSIAATGIVQAQHFPHLNPRQDEQRQ